MNQLFESEQARRSWIWITTMMVLTSIHHIFRLGYGLIIPSIVLTVLPYVLMRWYASTKNVTIMKTYSLYSTLMFIWFGFIDGFLDHVLKAIGLQNTTFLPGGEAEVVQTALSLWSPQAGSIFYEGSGVLTSIAGVVAMVYLVRMIQVKHEAEKISSLIAKQA
jgi:hypothetical protein